MERIKNKKLTFKKIGGGSFRTSIDGKYRIIKSGEVFEAYLDEIPEAFQDVIVCLDKSVLQATKDEKELEDSITEQQYEVMAIKGSKGWYNVVNLQTGKPINTKKMRKGVAQDTLKSLNY